MSKKNTKKKKNKQKNVSSNNKKTNAKEKNVKNKKNNVKEIKSDKSNKKDIKKTKTNENNNKNNIIKASKNEDNSIKEAKVYDSNTENNDIGKNIIRQGNKLIFSDAGNEVQSEDTKASDNNMTNSNEAASSNAAASDKHWNTDRGSFFENKLELALMSKKERRAAKKAAYREYTSTMTRKEKVSYFFYCYKWHIIISICCILLILCYGMAFYNSSRPTALSYVILNSDEFNDSFHEGYLNCFNLPESHQIQATSGYSINYDYYIKNSVSASKDGSDYRTLALACETGTFDVIISNGIGIKYCTYAEIIKPLDTYFNSVQYNALKDYIVNFQASDDLFYPYAIDISDTEFAKGLNLEYSNVYMAFPGVTEENTTNSLRLLEYVLGIKLAE